MGKDESNPGQLVEAVVDLIRDPWKEIRFDLSPVAPLMKARFSQAVGTAAVGTKDDFLSFYMGDLIEVPLYTAPGGVEYFIYFNKKNPYGERLARAHAAIR